MKGSRKVFLHIGLPKTGTTTIQNVFHAKREQLLADHKLLYPSLSPNLTNALCTAFHHDPMAHITNRIAGYTHAQIEEKQAEYLAALESEMRDLEWETLVLSAEGLSNLPAPCLRQLRDWLLPYSDDISVVVCVRHPVAHTRSVIQQIMKGGATLAELYEQLPLPGFKGKLSNAAGVFGADAIHLYDFDTASQVDGGIVGAFSRILGLPDTLAVELAGAAVFNNESLSKEAVAVLDSLNRLRPMFVDGVRNPARSGRELKYISMIRGAKFALPEDVEQRIRLETRPDIAWLNEAFGLTLYLDVFEDPEPDHDRPATPPSSAFYDSVSEIIGELTND